MNNKAAWEKYSERLQEIKALYPNVDYDGYVLDKDNNPIDITLLFIHVYDALAELKLEGEFIFPNVICSIEPTPSASSLFTDNGLIKFNLGLAIAAGSLPLLSKFISSALKNTQHLEHFKKVILNDANERFTNEVFTLFISWRELFKHNSKEIKFKNFDHNSEYLSNTTKLVIYHELGHLLKVYRPELYKKRLSYTYETLVEYIENKREAICRNYNINSEQLFNENMLINWTQEIDADLNAYEALCNTKNDYKQWAGLEDESYLNYQVSMSFYFFLLEMYEWAKITIDKGIMIETHPPAILRKDIFIYAISKKFHLDSATFISRHWLAGYVSQDILKTVASVFVNKYIV